MARVLFARGARGEIIRRLQLRLMERGVDPKGVDGDYGDNTQKAVAAFRQSSSSSPVAATFGRRCRLHAPWV